MGYMIEITHEKHSEMAENCEKVLKYAGKLMQNIEDCGEEDEREEREYERRSKYGHYPEKASRFSSDKERSERDPYFM